MKAIKKISVLLAFCAISFAGYKAYSFLATSELDVLIRSNVEALASMQKVDEACEWRDDCDCTVGTASSDGKNYTTTYSNHGYR